MTGAADALCKMHGPRNLGNAVFYDSTAHSWMTTNRLVKLSPQGTPEASDVGRLWNEGLAFWGWWFYLSKFYEVLDTFIILMKGKRSSTLQTYHHTGAMACMWAGMRYMSPPIWMFAFLNSGVHAMMVSFNRNDFVKYVVNSLPSTRTTRLQHFVLGCHKESSEL
jgi:GNS1/SUR4 family